MKNRTIQSGRYFAVVVGISNYQHGYALLDYAGSDATKVAEALRELGYQVQTLATDAQAGSVRKQALSEALEESMRAAQAGDTFLFYFAGHGSRQAGEDYLLLTDTHPERLATTALSLTELENLLKRSSATQRVLILDACRATSRAEGKTGFSNGQLERGFKERLDAVARSTPKAVRTAVLYACQPGQKARESDDERSGVFTLRLLEALRTSELSIGELYAKIQSTMPESLRGKQAPDVSGDKSLCIGQRRLPLRPKPNSEAYRARPEYLAAKAAFFSNPREGFRLFLPMAEEGDALAQTCLGILLTRGRGVPANPELAASWFQKAANQGEPTAQNNLGVMYRDGRGVPRDRTQARLWFEKAAAQGHTEAKNNLRNLR